MYEWVGDLQGFNDTEIKLKLANVQKVWQRFLYRNSILLEAERQKAAFGRVDDWAIEFLKLTEDDMLTTLIQVFIFLYSIIIDRLCTLQGFSNWNLEDIER